MLTGCGIFSSPREKITTVERLVYPELPPVPSVKEPELQYCPPDRPRVWWEDPVVKSDTKCKAELKENPELKNDARFISRCMEYRIDTQSNVVYGYDKEGQQCMVLNREKVRQHIKQYQDRVTEINRQRKEWKERNKAE